MLERVNKEIFSNIESNHFSYMLKVPKTGFVPERNFAFLFSNLEFYSISWEGNIDFRKVGTVLNESFLTRIAYSLKSIITDNNWIDNSTVTRSMDLISMERGQRSHNSFDVFDIKQKKECDKILNQHDKVAFVRQDIVVHVIDNSFHYAITAVNKNCSWYNKSFPEVGILFPIEHRLNLWDLRWLLNLHRYNFAFSGNIDMSGSVAVISDCLDKLKKRSVKERSLEGTQEWLTKESAQNFKKIIS